MRRRPATPLHVGGHRWVGHGVAQGTRTTTVAVGAPRWPTGRGRGRLAWWGDGGWRYLATLGRLEVADRHVVLSLRRMRARPAGSLQRGGGQGNTRRRGSVCRKYGVGGRGARKAVSWVIRSPQQLSWENLSKSMNECVPLRSPVLPPHCLAGCIRERSSAGHERRLSSPLRLHASRERSPTPPPAHDCCCRRRDSSAVHASRSDQRRV